MFETMTQFVMTPHLVGHTFRPPVGSPGYNRLFERRPYKTKDGYICASPYNEKQWRLFLDLIGRGELKDAPRFTGTAGIAGNIAELYQLFADAMLTRTTAEWLVQLDDIDIPSMPYHTPESIQEDPHLVATGFFLGRGASDARTHSNDGRADAMVEIVPNPTGRRPAWEKTARKFSARRATKRARSAI